MRLSILSATVALTLTLVAYAHATTLADLIASGDSVVSGDLVYSNFSYMSPGNLMSADRITVTDAPNHGLQFSAGWNTAVGPGEMESLISYQLTTSNPNKLFSGAQLSMAGVVAENGGVVFIGQMITDSITHEPYSLSVICDEEGPISDRLSDDTTFISPTTSLNVMVDISVIPVHDNPASFASVTFTDNSFLTQPAPEPASLAFLAIPAATLLFRRHRR